MKFFSKSTLLQLLPYCKPAKPVQEKTKRINKPVHTFQTEINEEIITFRTPTKSEFRKLVKIYIGGPLPSGLIIKKIS